MAASENDYASQAFLPWFVTEQVEEEKNVKDVLETLNMVASSRSHNIQTQRAPVLRFSATLGQEPEVELALV